MIHPNYKEAVEFLCAWSDMRVLTAIDPETRAIETRTFTQQQVSQMATWVKTQGYGRNIYFHVNPVMRPLANKARREDIRSMSWLHVDLDPRAREDIDAERERILQLLERAEPKPSCIVFSGGGYQAFWRLSNPMEINGLAENYEQAKLYNLQLELTYGGDNCHNVDRIMRVPGTINRPDQKKQRRGRVDTLACLVYLNETSYPLEMFKRAQVVQTGQSFDSNLTSVDGNVERFADLDDVPYNLADGLKAIITQGRDLDDPNRWPSRSEPLFWVCCELVRAGCTDEIIYSIITDHEFGISESVLEKKSGAEKYAMRQIERAREEDDSPMLRQINDVHAVIGDIGGRCRIISMVEEDVGDHHRTITNYQSAADFKMRYCNRYVETCDNEGKLRQVRLGDWWLGHPKRRQYTSTIFSPGRDLPGYYNLWRGFAFDPHPGDCSLYLHHVRENVCSGDSGLYDYVLGWMASAVQEPGMPGGSALVLKGRPGTGKGVFANVFGALFGRHYLPIRDTKHLVGSFNAHLRDCVVLFGDEAFAARDKRNESMLKTIITEDMIGIEAKGVDMIAARNCIHLIMASNEDWAVPVGIDDRRIVAIKVGDDKMKDRKFFSALLQQMQDGGYSALLYHLMGRNLSDFSSAKIPLTQELLVQKRYSFSPQEEWWFSKLVAGSVFGDQDDWPRVVLNEELLNDLRQSVTGSTPTSLGMFMGRVLPAQFIKIRRLSGDHTVRQPDGSMQVRHRPRAYQLPQIADCRSHWDDHFGGPYNWECPKELEVDEEAI